MIALIFLLGALLGVVAGVIFCIRYVRQEMTARIEPTMQLMQSRLANVQSSVDMALAAWHAEVHSHHLAQACRDVNAERPRACP